MVPTLAPESRNWERVSRRHRSAALDGWDLLAEWWFAGLAGSRGDAITAIKSIVPMLPVIPREESRSAHVETIHDVVTRRSKWIRTNVDWRTGKMDTEMVHRLELLKAKAV